MTLCKRTTTTSCQVDGKVDGVECSVVVDTGSERTMVRANIVSHRQLPETSHRLSGVTGHCTELRGPVDVKFQLGGKEESLAVYVADMEDTCILGLDYLVSRRCVLDFCAMQLTTGDRSVPLRTVEHRRPCTPERQPCRPKEKNLTKCRRATVEETLEAPEVDIRRLEGKDAEERCRAGDARRVEKGSKRRRRTPPQLCQAGLSKERVAVDKASHADFKEGDQVWLDNPRGKKGKLTKLQSPWEGSYTVVDGQEQDGDDEGTDRDGGVVNGQDQDGDNERADCGGGDLGGDADDSELQQESDTQQPRRQRRRRRQMKYKDYYVF